MATDSAVSFLPGQEPETSATAKSAPANRLLVISSFLAIWLIWGSTYLAIRYAVETIPPLYTAGFRHLFGGIILLAICLAKGLRPTWNQIRASIVIGFFFFLIGHGSLHWAETRLPSGLAALLIASEPIWVFVLSEAVARHFRVNLPLIGGVVLGLAGVALLLGRGIWSQGPSMFLGAVACLAGAVSWSIGIVYSRRSHLSGNPLLLSALSLLSGSVLLITAGTVLGEARGFHLSQVSLRSWESLAYLVIFGSVVAFSCYNWLMEHFSPTLVSTHTYINPIIAVLLGWILAGEKMTLNVGISAALVVGAVFLVDRGMARLRAVP
ncbi:MAG TPA: EamA family transporter [Candidatus Acidoferrum sp.]|nr:EamA family transporter [Candidatus Acidoferrum sp.]